MVAQNSIDQRRKKQWQKPGLGAIAGKIMRRVGMERKSSYLGSMINRTIDLLYGRERERKEEKKKRKRGKERNIS